MASAPETCVCSVCLTVYTDAVSMEHNFCPQCIDRVLITREGADGPSCPEYKEKLQESHLTKSTALENLSLHPLCPPPLLENLNLHPICPPPPERLNLQPKCPPENLNLHPICPPPENLNLQPICPPPERLNLQPKCLPPENLNLQPICPPPPEKLNLHPICPPPERLNLQPKCPPEKLNLHPKCHHLENLNLPPICPPPEDPMVIPCSYCIHSSALAVRTCLHCEAFLCEDHLQVHIKSPEHILSVPTALPEDLKCSIHKKTLEYYCYEDQACICVYCLAETHRMHRLEPLPEATEKRKERLRCILETMDAKREKADEDIQNLLIQKDEIPDKATSLTESVRTVFSEIRRQLEDLESKVLSEISRQKEQVSASISKLIQQLEIRKDEMSMEIRHIEKLLRSNDAVSVLQSQVVDFCNVEERNEMEINQNIHHAGSVDHFLVALIFYDGLGDIVTKAKDNFYTIESPEILLDNTTAANNVAISEDLRSATWSVWSQRRKETPRRFQQYQVFSIHEINSGRHYWEVETSKEEYWMVGMAYPSMETNGDQSWIGNNKKSWCFCRWHDGYSVRHEGRDVQLFPSASTNRYGVHVDYDSGCLSFYELCDPIRHLHTFHGNFSESLYAALWVNDNGWIKIRKW
ncbi:E3 ubiquitin-protein ligase TRIM39-like [Ranitomeya imitator]|uniref:E3 ubiquitin-protein ligase TRIM39-like n=1 Tax=Ranitomeya imitator TaxID=111125 RepID=UPI0037E77F2B